MEEACRGFLDLAKEGAAACVAVVFSDPAFAELFQRLYSRREWGVGRHSRGAGQAAGFQGMGRWEASRRHRLHQPLTRDIAPRPAPATTGAAAG